MADRTGGIAPEEAVWAEWATYGGAEDAASAATTPVAGTAVLNGW